MENVHLRGKLFPRTKSLGSNMTFLVLGVLRLFPLFKLGPQRLGPRRSLEVVTKLHEIDGETFQQSSSQSYPHGLQCGILVLIAGRITVGVAARPEDKLHLLRSR